jgi:hypothetical protein
VSTKPHGMMSQKSVILVKLLVSLFTFTCFRSVRIEVHDDNRDIDGDYDSSVHHFHILIISSTCI